MKKMFTIFCLLTLTASVGFGSDPSELANDSRVCQSTNAYYVFVSKQGDQNRATDALRIHTACLLSFISQEGSKTCEEQSESDFVCELPKQAYKFVSDLGTKGNELQKLAKEVSHCKEGYLNDCNKKSK